MADKTERSKSLHLVAPNKTLETAEGVDGADSSKADLDSGNG